MDVCYVDNAGNIVCWLSNTPQLVPSMEPPKPGKRRGQEALADDAGLYNVSTIPRRTGRAATRRGAPVLRHRQVLSTWWSLPTLTRHRR